MIFVVKSRVHAKSYSTISIHLIYGQYQNKRCSISWINFVVQSLLLYGLSQNPEFTFEIHTNSAILVDIFLFIFLYKFTRLNEYYIADFYI